MLLNLKNPTTYVSALDHICELKAKHGNWNNISEDDADRIVAQIADTKLVYNNSPSFNWTLNFRKQVIAK